ncbi:hypothetical protein CR513_55691, partial [Mucuna pruriens]
MKPFHESYKFFKNRFFCVAHGSTRPSLLFDESGNPLFPFYWMDQPTVSITVGRDDLEDWEEKFMKDLSYLSMLSCSTLITNKGYTTKELMSLKKKTSRSPTLAAARRLLMLLL